MKKCKYISLIILQFLHCFICASQEPKLTFQLVPPGTTPGSKAGVQDSLGYMWIGGYQDPLLRYDGYHYKYYYNDPLDSNSLAVNWVEALCAGRNGFIWIGTFGYGLDRLDPATGIFKHYRYNGQNGNSLSNDTVRTIIEDREGMLWIGTQKGLNRLDPETGKFQRFYNDPNDPYSLSCNFVWKLYEDRKGTIWVGTGSVWQGDGTERAEQGGLNRFDKIKGKFIRYMHEPDNPHSLINNKVQAIYEDSRGTFWVGTAGDGLHTMDRARGVFERHLYDPAQPEKLSRPLQKKTRPHADDCITFIIEDAAGAVWAGTLGNGVNRYDPTTKKVTHFPKFTDKVADIQTNVAWWACNSRDGMLWIGCWSGLFMIDPLRKDIPYFVTGRSVDAIYADTSGILWYSGNPGLARKDQSTGIVKYFVNAPRNPHSISNNIIFSIYEDRRGNLWVGTWKGLNRFDPKTEKFIRYGSRPGEDSLLATAAIESLYEDRNGFFWIGSSGGLIRMDLNTNRFTRYVHNPTDTNSLSDNEVNQIFEDNDGNLWLATRTNGLNLFVRDTKKFKHFLPGTHIEGILQDWKGIVWVGTSAGLYRSNASLTGFSRFTGPNSELAKMMIVNGILEDNQKNLWINAAAGICRLNPLRNELVVFSRHLDVVFHNRTGMYRGKNDDLFFGGRSGYFAFSPSQLTRNKKAPQIVLSAFRIADQEVIPGKESVLKQPLYQTKEIRLNYNQNVFSFDFAGIHYSNPGQNRHLYMLEGLDKTWRKASEEKTAYYYNMPPGHYTFRIKASNSDGIWAEKAIAIIVSPPWYQTWWAYIFFAIMAGAAIYAFIQYRVNKVRTQHEIVIQKHKATELEMQALRAQMNPHFIFNSLNSINRFILQSDKEKASQNLTKFSRLVRLILQNSQVTLIPLESELESLQLYLELEAVRFDHQFEFKIKINDDLDKDKDVLKVPPLIIQPYAENAIWHGLMQKEDKGHLQVEIYRQDDEVLCCKITDDGIGRKKAAELKSKSASTHKSMGMRITAERIAILQQKKQLDTTITIIDLILPDGSAGGTEVIIKIPVML